MPHQKFALSLVLGVIVLLTACGDSKLVGTAGSTPAPLPVAQPELAKCVMQSPFLAVGDGLDAPGRLEMPVTVGAQPASACRGNTQFRFGSGRYDITGVVANTGGMGWEHLFQILSGLHTRQYSRAFVIASPCNGQRVLMVSADIGLLWPSVRSGVLAGIAADPALAAFYSNDNVMLSATHTHQGPAGYSHDDGGNLFHYGFDALVLQTIVDGMLRSIQLAHANIEAHPETSAIRLASGELLNTNVNRSKVAFDLNGEDERRAFLNSRGEPVDTNKRMVQMNLVRSDGSAVGSFNWFGVHATVIGEDATLVSGDIKGFASLGFEKIMQSHYDAPTDGSDRFVAAFAQADEGDASPNLFIAQRPYPDPTRGGGADEYESNAISGTKQLAKALDLYAGGSALSGPVEVRFFNIPISAITVTDPVVLAGLQHPPALDAETKRTCMGALGVSFIAGAEDGPAPGEEGVSCNDSPDVLAAAAGDFAAVFSNPIPPPTLYSLNFPTNLVAAAAMCQLDLLPVGVDFGCQAEKPVAIPSGADVVPVQLVRIGNLAVLGLPWEVTTIAARRIRQELYDVLSPIGIDTVVIAGLTNSYVNYLTTREEYSSQQYEGASTLYGPWTLAVVQQEARRLAASLRDGVAAPDGPPTPADLTPTLIRPAYVPSDVPGLGSYGAVVTDVPATAAPGDTVRAEFQAGHPRNDLRIQASYVYAEREQADGRWQVVAEDRDPELIYVWKPAIAPPVAIDLPVTGASTAEAVWTIPNNTPPGRYRLRHEGASQAAGAAAATPYSGVSSVFTLAGAVSDCP